MMSLHSPNALVTDVDGRPGDQLFDLTLALATKRAREVDVPAVAASGHGSTDYKLPRLGRQRPGCAPSHAHTRPAGGHRFAGVPSPGPHRSVRCSLDTGFPRLVATRKFLAFLGSYGLFPSIAAPAGGSVLWRVLHDARTSPVTRRREAGQAQRRGGTRDRRRRARSARERSRRTPKALELVLSRDPRRRDRRRAPRWRCVPVLHACHDQKGGR